MDDKGFKERRKYTRFDNPNINFRTKEIDKVKGPTDMLQAAALNMSAEGICFRSEAKLKPGAIIELDVVIPFTPSPVHLEGAVRWSRPVEAGDGKGLFDTGIRLSIAKNDESRFLMYMCEKMEERIEELEKELEKIRKS